MKITHKDLKKGILKAHIQNLGDLWYLSHIIDVGDFISGKTQRKIKMAGEGDRSSKVHVKWVFLKIQAEKIEFHKYSDKLRVSGKVVEGPEDVPRGSYHTLTLEPTVNVTIQKQRWLKFQLDKLNDAVKVKEANIMICLLDRENAIFAELKNYGFEVLSELKGNVQSKNSPEVVKSSFYQEIIKTIKNYDAKNNYTKVIIASPAFWKEYLVKALENEEVKKKTLLSACNSIDVDGINEVLKRPEIMTALAEDRVVKEMNAVEKLLTEIRKEGTSVYGFKETSHAITIGAVKTLLVTDLFLHDSRENGTYHKVDKMLKTVDEMKGKITVISSEHDGGQKLAGLGGIGALLRYKL
jgi:protein pelota